MEGDEMYIDEELGITWEKQQEKEEVVTIFIVIVIFTKSNTCEISKYFKDSFKMIYYNILFKKSGGRYCIYQCE